MKQGFRATVSKGRVLTTIVCAAALLCAMSGSAQQNSGNNDGVRGLNNQLLQAYAQLQSSSASVSASMRAQAGLLIQQRASALETLIEQNPGEGLRLSLPSDVLSELASAFPGARSQLETHGRWEGPIEYIIEDSEDFKSHRNIRAMTVGGETLYIQFAGAEPSGLKNGDVLRVDGVRAGNQVAADYGSSIIVRNASNRPSPPPGLTCSTLGVQPGIVLMVTMPGVPLPTDNPDTAIDEGVSRPRISDMFNSLTNLSLNDFWRENSYGVTSANVVVAQGPNNDWFTLDQVYSVDQTAAIRTAAIAAADSVVDFRQYTRLFLVINGMTETVPPSTWAGQGTIGCGTLSSADGNFNASTSWMKATSFPNQDNYRGAHLAIHEAGHNLGLQHSNSRDFASEVLGAPGSAGVVDEYNDVFSEMGRGFGHYTAPHKAKLGWFPTQVQTITTSGVYTVQPTEVAGSIQALKIRRGTDNANWLWVEYRQPTGKYDSTLSAPFVLGLAPNQTYYLDSAASHIYSGGVIHYEDATTGGYSHLLDFTPQSILTNTSPLVPDDWLDPPLVGSWSDLYTGLSITTSNPTGSSLTVAVVYGTGNCVESNPTVTLSPLNPSAKRGQTVSYTISVTNNDTSPCFSKTFNLASSLPAGWSSSLSQTALTIGASSTASITMTKTVPSSAAYATFAVDASAASGTYAGSATASVTVKPGK